MALRSTVYKVELSIADLDHQYYADHSLTVARHPSETDERLMARLIAFACLAGTSPHPLTFAADLSVDDEPALWARDLTGAIELWVEVGLPDERALRKAQGRSGRVAVFAYGGRKAEIWFEQQAAALRRIERLEVWRIEDRAGSDASGIGALAERALNLSVTIQDQQVLLSTSARSHEVQLVRCR